MKIILDLCGGTGAWSRPYKKVGYDVRVITLPKYDIRFYTPPDNVYGILAAPPCAEFSIAKGNAVRDFEKGMEIVEACLRIIWLCRKKNKLAFWALENPTGCLRQFLGRPALTFQPWYYGEKRTKRTDLWGYFNEPKRTVYTKPEKIENGGVKYVYKRHYKYMSDPICPKEYQHLNLNRSDIRSITPRKFAEAFFLANP